MVVCYLSDGASKMTDVPPEKTSHVLYEISFDNDEPFGICKKVDKASSEGPIVVAFPGNGLVANKLDSDENAGRLANNLRKILKDAGVVDDVIRQTRFYVIGYDFPNGFDDKDARTLMYKKHGRSLFDENTKKGTNGFSAEEENPEYIERLYHQIIEDRISRLKGKMKLSDEIAEQNMGQVVFFEHCNGAYTALSLEEVMKRKMQELKYTKESIGKIQKQVSGIAYAPACPLGVSGMNIISFASVNDTVTGESYNNAQQYLLIKIDEDREYWVDKNLRNKDMSENQPFDFKLSFYPDRLGNIFLIKQKGLYKDMIDNDDYYVNSLSLQELEHNNIRAGAHPDSKVLDAIMCRVFANSVLHAHEQQKKLLPPLAINDLVVGKVSKDPKADQKIFDDALQWGNDFYKKAVLEIRRLNYEFNKKQK